MGALLPQPALFFVVGLTPSKSRSAACGRVVVVAVDAWECERFANKFKCVFDALFCVGVTEHLELAAGEQVPARDVRGNGKTKTLR